MGYKNEKVNRLSPCPHPVDLGFTYSWGGIGNVYIKLLSMKSDNLASAYKTIEKSAQKAIDKAIESFK